MPLRSRLLVVGLTLAPSLVLFWAPYLTPSLALAAPSPGPTAAAPPPVQRPSTGPTATTPASPGGGAASGTTAAPGGPSGPPPTAVAPGTQPDAQPAPAPTSASAPATTAPEAGAVVPTAPAPVDPPPGDPAELPGPAAPAAPAPATPGLAEQLLGPSVNQHPTERPPTRVRSEEESAEAEDQAIAAMYRSLYRPSTNPGRFNIVARGVYVLAGSRDNSMQGRLGGLSADIGQSFNKFGYAVTLVAQFGNLLHTTKDRQEQTIALVGGGPTLSLGRLALLQRGFLDVRVGYDFFAGPTRQIVDNAPIADGIRAPHGPRVSLNMGLLTNGARARKLFHGFGLTLGYQALVHSLRGDWPVVNMLQFGIVYWGG